MFRFTTQQNHWCKFRKYFLIFSWCGGLFFGVSAACCSKDNLVPMIRAASTCPASLSGLLLSVALPFLISAFAITISEPWLLFPISALKAFCFGFCACGVNLAFGSAGWLVRVLFLFSDVCVIPLMFLFWLRYFDGKSLNLHKELAIWIIIAVCIGVADYCLISPFQVYLI